MFEFQKTLSDKYEWPVELKIPSDGGKTKIIKFIAVFKRLRKTQTNLMLESARELDVDGTTLMIRFQTVLDQVLVGVKAKTDEGKIEHLPAEVKEELLEISGAEPAIFSAYTQSLSGEREKN